MWRALPQQGTALREICVENGGRGSEVVILPASGERVRLPVTGELDIETVGRVRVRSSTRDDRALTILTGEKLELTRAEVAFDGTETQWEALWRRARTRSRPWWRDPEDTEIDLDFAMAVRLTITAR
jgi:hypothetical protein